MLAVATSAVRDAENGEAFLGEVEWSYGFTTRLLSGEEEAALTLRGVGDVSNDTLVLDVGGGSTELIMRERAVSLDVGSVRLTELFGEDIDAIAAHVRPLLPELAPPARASASRAPSRRSRRSTSASRSTTASRCTDMCSRATPWRSSSRGSRRCRSTSGGACPRSIPIARP